MECNICHKEIKEPFHVEINPILIKHDISYVGGRTFTNIEKEEFSANLIMHQSCWQKIIKIKHDKNKKLEVI